MTDQGEKGVYVIRERDEKGKPFPNDFDKKGQPFFNDQKTLEQRSVLVQGRQPRRAA